MAGSIEPACRRNTEMIRSYQALSGSWEVVAQAARGWWKPARMAAESDEDELTKGSREDLLVACSKPKKRIFPPKMIASANQVFRRGLKI